MSNKSIMFCIYMNRVDMPAELGITIVKLNVIVGLTRGGILKTSILLASAPPPAPSLFLIFLCLLYILSEYEMLKAEYLVLRYDIYPATGKSFCL